jgi:hypothetical protein
MSHSHPISLPQAELIGYSSEGKFFGDDTARWKTVQTVTIQGVMDPTEVDNMITDGSDDPSSANAYLGHSVSVNGVAVNNSRLIRLDFPASFDTIFERHNAFAKYIATYEVYIVPTSSSMLGISFNDLKSLDEFSEDINFETDENNNYTCTHEISITYSSGTGGGATDGVAAARTLAETIYTSTPSSIPSSVQGHPGSFSRAGKRYHTESFDIENNSCSFSREYNLLSTNTSAAYTCKISNSSAMGDNGIILVQEQGEIIGIDTAAGLYASALSGFGTESSNAYSRCSALYSSMSQKMGTTDNDWSYTSFDTLNTTVIEKTSSHDTEAGKIAYTISFNNDPVLENSNGYQFLSKITKERAASPEQVYNYTEEATIKDFNDKGSFAGKMMPAFTRKKNSSGARIFDFFGVTGLKKISENSSFQGSPEFDNGIKKYGKGGKEITFTITHTDDRKLFPYTGINKLEINTKTSIGALKKTFYEFPNLNPQGAVYSFGEKGKEQVEISTRSVTYKGILSRNKEKEDSFTSYHAGENTIGGEYLAVNYAYFLNRNLQSLGPYVIGDLLSVYEEFANQIPQTFLNKYYIDKVSYNFDSNYNFELTADMKFVVPRPFVTESPWGDTPKLHGLGNELGEHTVRWV